MWLISQKGIVNFKEQGCNNVIVSVCMVGGGGKYIFLISLGGLSPFPPTIILLWKLNPIISNLKNIVYFTVILRKWNKKTQNKANNILSTYLYRSGFLDYCLHLYCYVHNVLADMSSGLLQMFVEHRNLHGTLNHVLYLIHGGLLVLILLTITKYKS